MSLTLFWIQFIVLAIIIMVSGSKLVKDAEIIADQTRLGGTLIGIILLSVVTSLPELFNGAGAVLFAKAPDLTVGDIVGSLLINLLIFGAVILFLKKGQWEKLGTPSLMLSGVLSIGMTGVYILVHWLSIGKAVAMVGWMGWYSFLIAILYATAIYTLYRFEKSTQNKVEEKPLPTTLSFVQAVRGFVINSLFVVGAGTYLPLVANKIAELSGWTHSFMGVIFIAIATSLPELVVVFQAVRLGLIHMALGDVFGSNLFDIAILPLVDALYFAGDLLSRASAALMIGGAFSILMTLIILGALKIKAPEKGLLTARFTSLLLGGCYLLAVCLMLQGL